MIATCIEDNRWSKQVLHEVHDTVDGKDYRIILSAECPMTAIKVAQEIPLTYWEELR